jgi:hypothetical protein
MAVHIETDEDVPAVASDDDVVTPWAPWTPPGGWAPDGQGFATRWQVLPESTHIEDRRDWNLLGYDDNGNAFSKDGQGNVWVQPFRPNGGQAAWGDAVKTGPQAVPDGSDDHCLHTDEPMVDEKGHADFDSCCGSCAALDEKKKKKQKQTKSPPSKVH